MNDAPTPQDEKPLDSAYTDGSYHGQVFDADPATAAVVARMRAAKLSRWIGPDHSVLEYGAGTGLNLRDLAFKSALAYEPGAGAADLDLGERVEVVGAETEIGDRRFGRILCHHVLEHVTDPFATLGRMTRWIEPSGRLVLYVPYEFNRRYRRYWAGEPNRHLFAWNPLTLGNLATAAGWQVKHTGLRSYGYQQRLAPLARVGMPVYRLALGLAALVRPCREIELVAEPAAS